MKKNLIYLAGGAMMACGMAACQSSGTGLAFEHQGDSLTLVHVSAPGKYLLLPIQESSDEGKVRLETGSPADAAMDVRLATDSIEYYVPFKLPQGGEATVSIRKVAAGAVCWEQMVYKDGEYHLYFQYNPYGSKWGNMHWGHSVSTDLVHWEHLKPAIARDTLGHIFSGSTVVDKAGTAGYGANAMIALYTSASDKYGQIQCMAYSTDNGRTYTKYGKNPVLTPFDGLKDFRDPKVFWYEPEKKWVMIVSADKEMRFYASHNLKDWEYMSAFGKGYGAQPNQFECPDFVQLPLDGNKDKMKWVMLVNINPGCMFGGSATEYFVGDFDGKEFTCDTKPEVAKWLDYGKDHYAAVCFSNTGERVISIPWMSNWQYANVTPIRQYRGANGLPRELSLYTKDGQVYVAANVVKEVEALRKDTRSFNPITVEGEYKLDEIVPQTDGAYELEMDITPGASGVAGFDLMNAKGEIVKIYLDMKAGRLVMDRTESGLVAFGDKSEPHAKETDDHRKTMSVNYQNDFALGTWAPLSLCEGKTYHLDVFVDKCSIEIFVDGGRFPCAKARPITWTCLWTSVPSRYSWTAGASP